MRSVRHLRVWIVCALLLCVTAAGAESFYYREVPKDGRLYVFASSARYDAFAAGKPPVPPPIMREGWGPAGETVVFDSVEALNLFAFKHDKTPEESEAPVAPKPWFEKITFSGLAFGDAYAVMKHHDAAIGGASGFWLRRAYLTTDFAVTDVWSGRVRLEVNSPGDFTTNARMNPYIKDAFLTRRGKVADLIVGLQPSPTWEFIEPFWGYRPMQKTPADLYRLGAAREFGLGTKVRFAEGRVTIHAVAGNGSAEGSETNEGKKAMVSARFNATPQLVVELYADREDRPASADRTTLQAFAGWKGERSRFGLQFVTQDRESGANDATISVASLFGVADLSEKLSVVARVDRVFDPNPEGRSVPYVVFANNAELDFAIVGLDYRVTKRLSVIPSLERVSYRNPVSGTTPDDDLFARVTLSVQF